MQTTSDPMEQTVPETDTNEITKQGASLGPIVPGEQSSATNPTATTKEVNPPPLFPHLREQDLELVFKLKVRHRNGKVFGLDNTITLPQANHPAFAAYSINQLEAVLENLLIGPAKMNYRKFLEPHLNAAKLGRTKTDSTMDLDSLENLLEGPDPGNFFDPSHSNDERPTSESLPGAEFNHPEQ